MSLHCNIGNNDRHADYVKACARMVVKEMAAVSRPRKTTASSSSDTMSTQT